jgi:hypothetical protein
VTILYQVSAQLLCQLTQHLDFYAFLYQLITPNKRGCKFFRQDHFFVPDRDGGDAKARLESWEVSDGVWERIELLIPCGQLGPRSASTSAKRGDGRKPKEPRQVFEAIVYVLAHRLPIETSASAAPA